jgi:4-oxalocrotonate tautomerase
MPHVIVKLWPGTSDAQKRQLSDAIVTSVTDVLGYGAESVSVGFDEVAAADWDRVVFRPLVAGRWDSLTQKPGYGPKPDC